jgi:hypothetical protein
MVVTVYSDSNIRHVSAPCGQTAGFLGATISAIRSYHCENQTGG